MSDDLLRRPIKSRNTVWAGKISRLLISLKLKPNHISIASVFFAFLSGVSILYAFKVTENFKGLFVFLSLICIQLRLLCNLFDGMVAVEGGFKTKSGEIFNELPDRFSDCLIIVPIGYCLTNINYAIELAWCCGVFSVLTAYTRSLGGACGVNNVFHGPMAKPQRMALLTVAYLVVSFLMNSDWAPKILYYTLVVLLFGTIITLIRRTYIIINSLEKS